MNVPIELKMILLNKSYISNDEKKYVTSDTSKKMTTYVSKVKINDDYRRAINETRI